MAAEKITGVHLRTGPETITLSWSATKVPTDGPHAGRPLKMHSTLYIPRIVFATAVEAWRTQEGA